MFQLNSIKNYDITNYGYYYPLAFFFGQLLPTSLENMPLHSIKCLLNIYIELIKFVGLGPT